MERGNGGGAQGVMVRVMANVTDHFELLWDAQEEFSVYAFGPSSYRGPRGPLEHLKREAGEAQEKPNDISEFADCLILVLDATRRAGFSRQALLQAAILKVYQNAQREWPDWRTQPGDAVLEHVRCGGEFPVEADSGGNGVPEE